MIISYEKLSQILLFTNTSRTAFREKSKIGGSTWSKIIHGEHLKESTVNKIAKALGVDKKELF